MTRQIRTPLLLAIALLVSSSPIRAQEAANPLRLLPDNTVFMLKVEQPRKLIDLGLNLASMKELQGFSNYREFLNSTNFRRFQQFVAYFEKQMGYPWPELVDQLAGNGAVLAVFDAFQEKRQAAAMFVLQGKDEQVVQKYFKLAVEMLEQELARQEATDGIKKLEHRGVQVTKIGPEFQACVIGSTIVASNRENGLNSAIDAYLDKKPVSTDLQAKTAEARKLVPANSLLWAYAGLGQVKEQPGFKNIYDLPSIFPPFHVVFGGFGDVVRRSPYLAAALAEDERGVYVTIRMPKGRNGMSEVDSAHAPPPMEPGVRPLLEPKGTLFTTSFYLDLYGLLWEHRDKLYPPEPSDLSLPKVQEFDKKAATFLFGKRPSQLLQYAGTRHRIVVARQFDSGYKVNATPPVPSFAWVMEMRDPDQFAKTVEPIIRAVGLLAGFGADMKLAETHRGEHKLIGYRFTESEKNMAINNGVVFNFSPCFVRVGNQMIFSSTQELAHNLIDVVSKEENTTSSEGLAMRSRFSWTGLALALEANREGLITSSMLQEGSTREEAKKQVDLTFAFLDKLGAIESNTRYEPEQYQVELRFLSK